MYWWIGFNNLNNLKQKMGLNPLNLTSGHKFEPVQGLNSLLIGLVWPFKRSCLAFGLESYSNSILNLNKVWNLGVIFFILIGPVWPFKNYWIGHLALNHKWTSGHNFEPVEGFNPLGWVYHPDWSCLTNQKVNYFCCCHLLVHFCFIHEFIW